VVAFVAKHQHVIALLLCLALAIDLSPRIDYPSWLVELLIAAAASLGISRPTEVAANMSASLGKRGILVVGSLAAYLTAAIAHDEGDLDEPTPAAPGGDVIDTHESIKPDVGSSP
jgi:hypothetical protein